MNNEDKKIDVIYSILFKENTKDIYIYDSWKVDKISYANLKYFYDQTITKINVNAEYHASELYQLFEVNNEIDKNLNTIEGLIYFLKYRDVFNTSSEYIELLYKIIKDKNIINLNKLVTVDKTFGNIIDDNILLFNKIVSSKNEANGLMYIFRKLGILPKNDKSKKLNPLFNTLFGLPPEEITEKQKNILKEDDINFNDFFPGKSNGRILRYLKIFKAIPPKENYTKDIFKKDLIATGFVDVKKNELYYKKEEFEELKKWIKCKILDIDYKRDLSNDSNDSKDSNDSSDDHLADYDFSEN